MAVTANGLQQEIVLELGGALPGGPEPDAFTQQLLKALNEQMPAIWEMSALWSIDVPPAYQIRVGFLMAKKRATLVIMGQVRQKTDQTLGRLKVAWSQAFKNLESILKEADTALTAELTRLGKVSSGLVVGPITGPTTGPTTGIGLGGLVPGLPGSLIPDPAVFPWLYA